jgi:phosphopantetheinyl transferase (holo-ACP synthase)
MGWMVVKGMFEESTIYKTALGQGGGSGMAYSSIALLTQSGRLPLVSFQKCGGWGIGSGLELMFDMIKDNRAVRTALYEGGTLTIDPKDLPDNLVIDVQLDAELPQDKLQQANIASMLKQQGLASDEWIRENILNIGQSNEMTKKVIEEQFVNKMLQEHFTKAMETEIRKQVEMEMMQKMQEQQQMQAQQMAQAQQAGMQQQRQMVQQEQAARQQVMSVEERRQRLASANQFNAGMGGMSPIVGRGAIPASRPGMMPTPATGEPQGLQEVKYYDYHSRCKQPVFARQSNDNGRASGTDGKVERTCYCSRE